VEPFPVKPIKMVKEQGIDLTEARRRIAQTLAAKRFGTPQEFADACAFLCSAQWQLSWHRPDPPAMRVHAKNQVPAINPLPLLQPK